MTTPFVHLHVHTQYSMLDGAIRLADLIDKTQAYGMNAVAVTDHGAMYGALEFYTKANKAGIKPIVGCEFYISETDHLIHNKSAGHNFHIVLLAMNEIGYRNLMKLASIAQTKGFYYKPRIDRKLLFAHQEGLIALTACLHGEIPWTITHHGVDKAKVKALELQQVFGDRLYFEIQENGIPEQRTVNEGLLELGNDLGVKVVATNDCHYLNQEESYAHEVLLCIQTSKTINDANRFKFSTDELYFKPPEVMAKQFSYCPEALSNTLEVADRCKLELEFKENHFPIFPVPEGESLETLFEQACRDGLEQRLEHLRSLQEVSLELEQQYQERLEMEIKVIQEMGFSGYFLIVADFINWAKSQKIPVGPGRGCVLPDTKVLLSDGREVEIQDIEPNNRIITHLGNIFPVQKKMAYDCDEEIVLLDAANEILSLTQDHRVWAVRSQTCTRYCSAKPFQQYRPEWIEAGQLKKNDFVVFPRTVSKNKEIVFDLFNFVEQKPHLISDENSLYYLRGTNRLPTQKIPRHVPFDENLAKLLGYYIAEGWSRLGERRCGIGFGFRFHKEETAYAEEVQQLLEAVFGLESKIIPHKTQNSQQVIAYSKIAGEFLASLCGEGANHKHIPLQLVSHGKDELLKTLIAYLFRGDGHDGACNATISIKYSTISPVMASQLRLLLARFGYWTTLHRRHRRKKEKENWAVEISVKLAGRQLLQWNRDFPAFSIEQKQQQFYRNDSFYVDSRSIYLKIKKISRSPYQGKVYDISVPPDTSYIANSMAIHNSGAGSLAAFCMSITDIDPIPYGLLFERFLNVERVSMPDFDVDFCKERRDEVIDYVRSKYGGDDHVAQIVAYGSMKARAVLRDVGRVLEVPLPLVDKIAKLVPDELKITLKKAIDKEPRLRDAMKQDPAVQKLLTVAQVLEGLSRHKSTHAAGVVVSPKAMVEYLPVCVGSKKEILTQFDMKYTEMTGLIKFDFLGLKTLTVIDRALRLIKQDIGTWIDLSKIPMDDQRTYNLLCAGNSLGVFQLESDGMRELLVKMAPEQFTDLIALVALYRPGPLDSGMVDQFVETKHGRRPPEYPLPQIKAVLEETYGVIVYQEQVMKISNILASYSLGDADILRRAMGKKIPEVMEEERAKFMAGAKRNNIPEEKAKYVFDLMAKFAGYGFNKCVAGSTWILDAETGERLTVEELYQNQRSFTVHALGKDDKFHQRKVLDVIENGQKPVFELRTAQGHRITATANHPFRTLDGWTLLGDLNPGDRIAAPRRLPTPKGECWAEQLGLLPHGLHSTEDTIPAEVCVWVDEERRRADLTWRELESRSGVCMREFMGKGSSKKRGFRRSTLARLADFFASKRLAALAESDIFWDSVVSIEPRGQQQTFDLTVEKDHNFVADGLIVHNSHSAAYALVAYHTAYLKAHYPAQFLAALLSCDIDNTDKVVKYISECKQMSIPVLPPDINESYQDFTVINDRVRFGLGAVKNVGGSALELVIKEREKNGTYTGLADFCGRIDSSKVNRKVLENLIKAGAFDFVQAKRSQLMEVLDQALEHAKAVQRDRLSGQMSLFAVAGMGAGGDDQSTAEITFPSMDEWPDLQKLSYEKETIGFFLTGHPLDGVIETIRMVADAEIEALDNWREGQAVRVGGLIQQYKEHISKKGDRMAFTVLEDMTSRVEVIVFPDTFARCSHFLGKDEPLIVLGTIQQGERGAKVIAENIYSLDQAIEQFTEQATVLLHADRIGRNKLVQLKELIYQFHGSAPIKLTLHFDGRGEVDILPMKDITIRPCPDFFNKVKTAFGPQSLFVQMRPTEVQRKKRFGGQR